MNYRHIFHAGNFADVAKHLTLIGLCQALSQKEKPWCFLDIHAGRGLYRLTSDDAHKTQEYKGGVEKFVNSITAVEFLKENPSAFGIIKTYLSILRKFNYPEFYPGSPFIVQQCLRESDSMILVEKHPEEFEELKSVFKSLSKLGLNSEIDKVLKTDLKPEFHKNPHIVLHHQDGYQALKAFLPPKEKRGLILLDPPYESKDEWEKIIEGLKVGLKRFANGIFAVWYPIKNKKAVEGFKSELKHILHSDKILFAEIGIYPEDSVDRLNASGMAIINPPWQFRHILESLYPLLWEILSYQRTGYYSVEVNI